MGTGSELSAGARLYALLAAIRRSPIVLRLAERILLAREWASVRKSPDVDAYVSPGSPAMSAAPGARRAHSCKARRLVEEPGRRVASVSDRA